MDKKLETIKEEKKFLYRCIKNFTIEEDDDNGINVEREYIDIIKDSIWKKSKEITLKSGEIRLDEVIKDESGVWVNVSKEILQNHFNII